MWIKSWLRSKVKKHIALCMPNMGTHWLIASLPVHHNRTEIKNCYNAVQVKNFLNLFPGLCGVCSSESLDTKYNTQGQYHFWTKFWFWTLPQYHQLLRFGDRPGYFTRRRHDRDWERGTLPVAFFIYILHLCWPFCTALLNQLTSAARANGPKVREYSEMLNRLAAKIITP